MKLPIRKKHAAESRAWNLPELQAARDRRARRMRVVLACAVIFLLLVGGAWLVFRSPLFRIHSLVIEGNEQYSRAEIEELLRGRIFHGSLLRHALGFRSLLVWPETLSDEDLKSFPLIKSVRMEKSYAARSVTVVVEERTPLAIWCYEKTDPVRCVWFDREGLVLEHSLSVEGNLIRRVSDSSQDPKPMRSLILPAQFISNLFSILRVLDLSRLALQDIRLEDLSLQEVKVRVHGGPELMFSLRFPADPALPVIRSLQAGDGLRGKKFEELQYVDFRVENRAYFK